MFLNRRILSMATIMCLLIFITVSAMAQVSNQRNNPSGAAETQTQIGNAELEKAAIAYSNITRISQEFQQSIQGISDQEKRVELQEKANDKMISAVENAGIDLETYNAVIAKVQSDSETREKFMKKVQWNQ